MKRTPENSVTRQSKSRSAQAGSYSVIATLVLLVIAIVVNLIVGRLPGSWTKFDTTDTKMYSVGDQSKQIISNLQTDVTVYWIVQSGQEDQNLKNLLASYEGLNSHLKVEKKDPVVYPTFVSQYATTDLEDNSLIVVSDLDFKVIQYDDIFVYDYSDYMDGGSYTSEFFGEKRDHLRHQLCLQYRPAHRLPHHRPRRGGDERGAEGKSPLGKPDGEKFKHRLPGRHPRRCQDPAHHEPPDGFFHR